MPTILQEVQEREQRRSLTLGNVGGLPRPMPGGFALGSRAAIAGMVVSVSRDGGLEAVRAALGPHAVYGGAGGIGDTAV